ncbi:MAG: cupin-like domain-containing protein [Myxococcota bacterium]
MRPGLARCFAWTLASASWAYGAARGGFGAAAVLRRSLSSVGEVDRHFLPSRRTALAFRLLVLLRFLRGRNDVHRPWARGYLARARRELPRAPARATPVPELDLAAAATLGPSLRQHPRPWVIRGGAPLARDWSLAALREAFPRTPVWVRDRDHFAWEALGRLGAGDARYVANSEQLLLRHPELVRQLDVDRYRAWTGGRPYALQLFLGARSGSGLSFHCANNLNLFTMLHGRKRWTFVDPAYSYAMYPWVTRDAAYVASILDHPDIPSSHTDLFASCPREEVVLEPGDVLVSPPWWWHRVENLDPDTVGAASRWTLSWLPDTNRLFSFAQLFSPALLRATVDTVAELLENGGSLEARYARGADERAPTAIERVAHTEEQLLPGQLGRACWSRS